jgi:2-(1,2-epoxy-1,2-dihydrophenyl)acetyl-CoA isomerase
VGDLVRLDTHGEWAELVLNRPDKLNAMNDALVAELNAEIAAAERLASNGTLRCLLVRGEARAFCAGRDLADAQPGEDAAQLLRDVFNPLIERVASFPVPTIAAVQGACLGTGLGLALACDLVFVSTDAKLGSPFARIGAVLDSGAHLAFVDRLGPHRALELIYTGRLLSGAEAAALGLVNTAVPADQLLDHSRALAEQIAAGPTLAFRESKHLVRRIETEHLPLTAVLAAEAQAQGRASQTTDYAEGITAFQQKRTPTFKGR